VPDRKRKRYSIKPTDVEPHTAQASGEEPQARSRQGEGRAPVTLNERTHPLLSETENEHKVVFEIRGTVQFADPRYSLVHDL